MNENYRNNYNDDMEINLVDLMFYLLKQWKTLFIIAILGLFLGGGIWILKGGSTDKGVVVDELLRSEQDVNAVAERLKITPDVIRNMELAYQCRRLYERRIDYNQNSILMKLDPNEVYTGTLKYYISAGDHTELIGLLYENMISGQDFIHRVKEDAFIDCEEQYIRELVGCTLRGNENTVIHIDGADSMPQSIVVAYSVIYSDAEVCEAVLNIIREESEILRRECQEKYGEYVQETVFDGVQYGADNSRLDKQKSDIDVMNTCLINIMELEADFTDEEKAYYETVYLRREEENIQDDETEEETARPVSSKKGMMKWLLIGIMLGVICWGGYYFVKYLFDKRIKYAEELSDYYGLHLIGRYRSEGRVIKGIEKVQEQIVNRDMGICSSKEYLASYMNMLDEKSLLLVGDRHDQEVETLMKGLGEICPKAECGDLMQNSSETLESAKERAGIVLCVRKGKSTHTEIQRELEICRLQNIYITGAVVVE